MSSETSVVDQQVEKTGTATATGEEVKKVHPYEKELNAFKPNEWQLKKHTPLGSAPFDDDEFTFVDTITSLNEMITELRKVKELAVSVQFEKFTYFHHRCCLLEISTRTHDYVVDSIALKDELKVLNDIFTDESVLKVSYNNTVTYTMAISLDVWVVNFFVLVAARSMAKGLDKELDFNAVLKKHCSVELPTLEPENDWAARPLSDTQLKYARMRVHYMLYIHDIYRNELVKIGSIQKLYDQCTRYCRSSAKSDSGMGSHISLYRTNVKKSGELNHRQLECYRLLFKWRYETAKKKDKGIANVLQTTDMFNLAKKLPTDIEGVAKCFTGGVLPPLVESDIQVVHKLILQAINDVTDLSIVKFGENSATKRSAASKMSNSTAKRSRGDFRGGQLGRGVMMSRGGFHSGSSATGPMRGRGGFRRDHSEEGPILPPSMGRGGPQLGGMGPYMGHRMGPYGSEMGPIGPGMGSGMGSGYGQGMGPMSQMGPGMGYQMDSFGQGMDPHGGVSPGFISQIVEEVVGQMTMRGMSYGSNMSGMNNQGYGISRGGRGNAWR